MKELLKRVLPASARRRARRLGRIRWITKIGVVRRYGASPLREWRYVLLDPEVDSFTYPIANQDELARTLASVLNRSPRSWPGSSARREPTRCSETRCANR